MQIERNPSLAAATALGIGGQALAAIKLEREHDFAELPDVLTSLGGKAFVLGGGSNILAQDGPLPMVLIQPLFGQGSLPEIIGEELDTVFVRVGSGLRLASLLSWCAQHDLAGLEGLVGIPALVGGSIAMNAGAFGTEICDCLHELSIWTPVEGLDTLTRNAWRAGYRSFQPLGVEEEFIIVSAVLALRKSSPGLARQTILANLDKKKATQPLASRTAGSVFKNPPGHSAGKLLDEAGMRGRELGGVWFTDKHANFLANRQNGTFVQAMELIRVGQDAVARQFGINLELEIKVWKCR